MKCSDYGATLQSSTDEGLQLECRACAYLVMDCSCYSKLGRTPNRWVHCMECDELFKKKINTSKSGWRSMEV
jgi:hypothetical protein